MVLLSSEILERIPREKPTEQCKINFPTMRVPFPRATISKMARGALENLRGRFSRKRWARGTKSDSTVSIRFATWNRSHRLSHPTYVRSGERATVARGSLSRGTIIPLPTAPMDVSIASGTCTTPCRYVVVGLVGSTYFSCRSYTRYSRGPANAVA